MKNTKKNTLVLLLLFSAIVFQSNAGIEIYTSSLRNNNLFSGSNFSVYDHKYNSMEKSSSWKNQFTNNKVTNRIILSFDEKSKNMISSFTEFSVEFDVDYFTYDNSTNTFIKHTRNQTLKINYEPSKAFQNKSLIQFDGGNGMEVRVKNVTSSISMQTIPLKLEGQIEVTRYYTFDVKSLVSNIKYQNLDSSNLSPTKRSGELEISWDYLAGAEEYELEWTHVDDYDGDNSQIRLKPDQIKIEKNIFKNNSTRITTSSNSFRIPQMYESGYIVFRVRGVGRAGKDFNSRSYSRWSFEQPTNCLYLSCITSNFYSKNEGHETKLNWQSSISFAEDGKNKVAVTYFDGSLRSRQIVSKSNTENQVLVGETLYDHQGRAVIQVLPVPVNELNTKKIEYKGELSKNTSGNTFNNDGDYDVDSENGCFPLGKEMSTLSGASNYYSPNNKDKNGAQQFVPDAEGYPYTHVEYTPDNTGRIRRQSGVGKMHKLGSGKETQYMYSKPFQEELDRMFGSEVGIATRYKKNMVIDANGQVSISYLDPQGKVIATSLAGNSPTNVDQIPNDLNLMTVDLLNKKNNKDNNGSDQVLNYASGTKELGQQISVSTSSIYLFNYTMKGDKLVTEYIDNQGLKKRFCSDCVFDLKVRLKDECGNDLLPGLNGSKYLQKRIGEPKNGMNDNQNYVSYNVKNDLPNWQTSKPNGQLLPLEPGEYTLVKELKLNQDALNYYSQQYLTKMASDAKPNFEKIYQEELARMDFTGCNWTCETCKERAGNDSEKLAACEEICNMDNEIGITCESKFRMLIGDMSPNGQYAGYQKNEDTNQPEPSKDIKLASNENKKLIIDPSVHLLSIFNQNNSLPKKAEYFNSKVNGKEMIYPDWKHPFNPNEVDDNKKYNYLLEDGSVAYIIVKKSEGTNYIPEIENTEALIKLDEKQSEYFKIPAKYLKNVADFIDNWNLSYANSLVYYHPEYEYYKFCNQVLSSNKSVTFDEILMATSTKKEAEKLFLKNKFQVDSLSLFKLLSVDPFFNTSINVSPINGMNITLYKNIMNGLINTYVSKDGISYTMEEFSYLNSHCPNYRDDAPSCSNFKNCLLDNTGRNDDKHWQVYKSLYLSLKQKILRNAEINYVIEHNAYNGCIGVKPFNPFENNFITSTYIQPVQLNTFWSWLTNDKKSMKTVYNHRSQYLNPEQTCSFYTQILFQDKVARNPLPSTLLKETSLDSKFCYPNAAISTTEFPTLDLKDFIGTSMIPTNCNEENQHINDVMLKKAEANIFMECGQCPKAFQLQNFLSAVASRDKLTTNGIQLLCNSKPYYEIGPKILPDLKSENEKDILWNVLSHVPKKTLKIELKSGNKSTIIALQMKNDSVFDFQDIDQFCCLTATDVLNFYTQGIGVNEYGFKIKGTNSFSSKQVEIEGVIRGVKIDSCSFDSECKPTIIALQSQNLFNALLYRSNTTFGQNPIIQSKFINPNGVSLSIPLVNDLQTEVPIQSIFITDEIKNEFSSVIGSQYEDWMWKTTINANVLKGIIYDKDDIGKNCSYELTKTDNTFDFEDILLFDNLIPIPQINLLNGKYTQEFTITAMVKSTNQIVYKTLKGNFLYSSENSSNKIISMGECINTTSFNPDEQ